MKKIKKSEFVDSKDTIAATPGEMLAALRELQGLSQNDLAKLTGIAQANISNMEKGRQQIGRERAIILAKALHVHPAVILFPNYDASYKAA
ncbi:MAG: helix-turn-helix transcriptional regulator [bacterium]